MERDLSEIRKEMDGLDRELIGLYKRRLALAKEVAAYKRKSQKAVYDKEREAEKLSGVEACGESEFERLALRELYVQIMTASRRYQYMLLGEAGTMPLRGFKPAENLPEPEKGDLRVVYQGIPGSYSHIAARNYFGGRACFCPAESFSAAMDRVERGEGDYAVIPIENSSAGAVGDVYDLLMERSLYMAADYTLPVRHVLAALPGASPEDIDTVYSHHQALMQCERFLDKKPGWGRVSVANTAVAARLVRDEKDLKKAAIASPEAASLYGLSVLGADICESSLNATRFIILSREPIYRRDAKRVSIAFHLPDKSGELYNVLGHIIFNGLNMIKIESRPSKMKNWEYRFFIDIEGRLGEGAVENAMDGIAKETEGFKILGCY